MIGCAEVGEIMMRAFILCRVGLIEEGGVGSVLVGHPGSPDIVRLQGLLGRNGYPYTVLDATNDADGRAVVERFGVLPEELPLMVCPNGTVLKRLTDAEAGLCLGITPELDPEKIYDVAVVAAGFAGLAAAHWLMDLGWPVGFVLGAIVSLPTPLHPSPLLVEWRSPDEYLLSSKAKDWRTMPPRLSFITSPLRPLASASSRSAKPPKYLPP